MEPNLLHAFVLTFVPLFIVIDALGNLQTVVILSEGLPEKDRRRMVHVSILTAAIVGLVFLFFGQLILRVMNIPGGAFPIAGGIILLVFSIKYMTTGHSVDIIKEEAMAIVPIGTPLTVGPATITTLLLLAALYPVWMVLASFVLNLLIAWAVFVYGNRIARFLGEGGLRAISRVFSLLLAAIAVNMMIFGLTQLGILKL